MVKKVVKKTITKTVDDEGNKKTIVKEDAPKEHFSKKKTISTKKKMTAREREELLVENFVGLQHAMTNMSIKFGALSDNITKLLTVFEEAAKNYISGGKVDDKDMLKKIDSLLDQNKTIAQGLVLMESKLRGRSVSSLSLPGHSPNVSVPSMPAPPSTFQRPMSSEMGERPKPKPLPRI